MKRSSRSSAPRHELRALAERLGVLSEYVDQTGKVRRTSPEARETLLSVMGFDAPSEDAARGWLEELDHQERSGIVEPVRVVERDRSVARDVRVRLPRGEPARDLTVTVTEESGREWRVQQRVHRAGTIRLPTPLPYGYHTLRVSSGSDVRGEQSLIVVPSSCVTPDTVLGSKAKAMGIVANLYAMRREDDWGIGDTTTLAKLVEWGAARGAEFVGVNPLHALFNRGMDVSPYSPVSRLFRNPIYIDADAASDSVAANTGSLLERKGLREASHVDYEKVFALKLTALTEAHKKFREGTSTAAVRRRHAYEEFVRARDPDLTRFATWFTIAESSGIPDWRRWPAELHDPDSATVDVFRNANAERVDFHRWLQFELDRQLSDVAMRARTLGMRIGVYQDLAIGSNPGGSDTWSNPELFLTGASVGAPPDPYSAFGQNWGLPPMNPHALRSQGYRYWIQLLRRAFDHAGALRIDHILGLFRSFWIPDGGTGLDGAYVRFPTSDLFGILALESVRHDAIVVGEDLGTVPKEVPPTLKKWGVLSSKVLYFERDKRGFRPAAKYPRLSLATANTHDMAPIAGYWRDRDVELRGEYGLLPKGGGLRIALRERAREKDELLDLIGLVAPPHYDIQHFPRFLTGAVHEFLCRTPAALVGLSFDDLTSESDPVNVPGVSPDKYPSWRRRNRMSIEAVGWSFEVDDAIRCKSRRRER